MSYYPHADEDLVPHPKLILYSVIDKNGIAKTIQKNDDETVVAYKTQISRKFLDSIIAQTSNAKEESFEPIIDGKKVWYCGPTMRLCVRYENGKEITFNYLHINAYSRNVKLKIAPALYNNLVGDSLNSVALDSYSKDSLIVLQQDFQEYTVRQDILATKKIGKRLEGKRLKW